MRIKILHFQSNSGSFYVAYGFARTGDLVDMAEGLDPVEAETSLMEQLNTPRGRHYLAKYSETLPI
jgi:hypothetical protein